MFTLKNRTPRQIVVLWITCTALMLLIGTVMTLHDITYFWLRQVIIWGIMAVPTIATAFYFRKK